MTSPIQDAEGNAVLHSETRALKDVWLYDDARLETEIQQDIFSKLGGSAEEARPYFLDILHCDVVKCAGNQPDITPICQEARRRASEWAPRSRPSTPHSASTHKLRRSTSSPSKHMPPNNPISPRARKHVRMVFKEDCQSVFELNDFQSFIKCILDCVKGIFVVLRFRSRPHTVTSAWLHAESRLPSSRRQRRQLFVLPNYWYWEAFRLGVREALRRHTSV